MLWTVKLSKNAEKDSRQIKGRALRKKVVELLRILETNPYQTPPAYEKLEPLGENQYSRRINKQHRLVYKVHKDAHIVEVSRMWSHYKR